MRIPVLHVLWVKDGTPGHSNGLSSGSTFEAGNSTLDTADSMSEDSESGSNSQLTRAKSVKMFIL